MTFKILVQDAVRLALRLAVDIVAALASHLWSACGIPTCRSGPSMRLYGMFG